MTRLKAVVATLAVAAGLAVAVPAPAGAIVNGSNAVTNPGSVSLWTASPNRNRCSGTLVDDEWVLTAAHCVYAFTAPGAGPVEARVGALNNTTGSAYTSRTVTEFHWHPSFDPNTLVGDVMLLRLSAPVTEQPALWNYAAPPVGTIGDVSGWGWVCDGPAGLPCSSWYAGPLQRYSTRTLPDADCVTVVDGTQHSCFESATGSHTSACPGDSGAGMTTKVFSGGQWRPAVRVVVLGDGDDWSGASCANAPDGGNGLGLGLDVAPYRTWMQSTIGFLGGSPGTPPAPTARALALIG